MTTYIVAPAITVTPLWSGDGTTPRLSLAIDLVYPALSFWTNIGYVIRPAIVWNGFGGGGGSTLPAGYLNFG